MEEMSIMLYTDNPVSGSPSQIPFARLFILKVNSYLWLDSQVECNLLSVHFWIHLHPMFSWLWLVQDGAFPNLVIQNLGCQEIAAWVLTAGVGEDRGLSHRWGRRVFHLWWAVELCSSWWLSGWWIGSSCPGYSHTVSWVWVLSIYGIPLVFHCFVGSMGWRKCNQCQVVWVHHPLVNFWIPFCYWISINLGHTCTGR